MAGKLPFLKVYISDTVGGHDFKNKDRTVTLWMSDKVDKNGNNILTGGIDSDPKDSARWCLGYRFVAKPQGGTGREIPDVPDDGPSAAATVEVEAVKDDVPF